MTNTLTLWRAHFWINVAELIRLPAYAIPTLLFPTLLFAFFGLPYGSNVPAARLLMASYSAYAVLGVGLFQFGVGIAVERSSTWESFLRTLPVGPLTRLAARVSSAVLFAGLTAGAVILTATLFSKAHPNALMLLRLGIALLLGSVPFAFLGVALGYWVSARAAVPVASLLYLPLSLGGGLWFPPQMLPKYIAPVSPYLPTRAFGEIVWWSVLGGPFPMHYASMLAAYTALFAGLALWGYRRDEGERYT
jgi:ABC-2 type transport system permease protein